MNAILFNKSNKKFAKPEMMFLRDHCALKAEATTSASDQLSEPMYSSTKKLLIVTSQKHQV